MPLINAYTTRPGELQQGDVMAYVVVARVTGFTPDGTPIMKLYRCRYDGDDVPDGDRIFHGEIMTALFPSFNARMDRY
jgi:hypothetical protein